MVSVEPESLRLSLASLVEVGDVAVNETQQLPWQISLKRYLRSYQVVNKRIRSRDFVETMRRLIVSREHWTTWGALGGGVVSLVWAKVVTGWIDVTMEV